MNCMPEQPADDSLASVDQTQPRPPSAGQGAQPAPSRTETSAEYCPGDGHGRGVWVEGDVFRGIEHRSTVLQTPAATYQLGDFGMEYLDRHVKARIEVLMGVLTTQQQGDPVVVFEIVDIGPAETHHPGSEL